MKKLFKILGDHLRLGEDIVLATIVEQQGSTPRGAGAAMIVNKDGRITGTIGGGAIEFRAECRAKQLIDEKKSFIEHFYLKPNQIQDIGMVCGGDVTVDFRFLSATDNNIALIDEAIKLFGVDEEFWMILKTDCEGEDGLAFYSESAGISGMDTPSGVLSSLRDKPNKAYVEGHEYFSVELQNMTKVYIFGGGHVSQALVPCLNAIGFKCIVLEDREEFCRPELFPKAEKTMLIDISKISDYIEITERDFVCIMTRGHKDDLEVQAQIMNTPAYYIGVIGSKSKKASVFAQLKERGFTDDDLARVTTPIGLDIKAETPAEIAVSIAGQMIMRRAELVKRERGDK